MSPYNIEAGKEGEIAAACYLETIGFRILDRHYVCKLGELDIVAMEGKILVFVEVKARTSDDYGGAFRAVTNKKQDKVTRAALSYIKAKGLAPEFVRFDAVAVKPGFPPALIRNAFIPRRYTF